MKPCTTGLSDVQRREQWLRDLAQVRDDEPCFFCRMGELIRARMELLNP